MKMASKSYKGNAVWVAAAHGPSTAGGVTVNPELGVGATAVKSSRSDKYGYGYGYTDSRPADSASPKEEHQTPASG